MRRTTFLLIAVAIPSGAVVLTITSRHASAQELAPIFVKKGCLGDPRSGQTQRHSLFWGTSWLLVTRTRLFKVAL